MAETARNNYGTIEYPTRIVFLTEETVETLYPLGRARRRCIGIHRSAAGSARETEAVRNDHVYEVKSTFILQPGPAALTDGVRRLHAHIARAAQSP